MGSFLVSVFWVWCGVSLVILVVRFVRRRTTNPPARPIAPLSSAELFGHAISEPTPESMNDGQGEPLGLDRARRSGIRAAPSAPSEIADLSARLEQAGPGRGASSSTSVADVLSGIQMPCGLAPLMGVAAAIDSAYVVFVTEGHRAEEVGSAVGAELERIGCEIASISPTTIRADRGSNSVAISVHPDPNAVMDGAELRFPTAPEGSVVVEFHAT